MSPTAIKVRAGLALSEVEGWGVWLRVKGEMGGFLENRK